MQTPCSFCGGAAHPATGCQYSENIISCWRCTKEAWHWVKGWTHRRADFYEAAGRKRGGAMELVNQARCERVTEGIETPALP
jgi:hypothetical protein